MKSTTHFYDTQEIRHIIPLEDCLDIVLTSGILKRKGTISKPSSRVFSGSSNIIDDNQGACSIQALDKLLAENPFEENAEDDGQQSQETTTSSSFPSSSSTLASSLSADRVNDVIASAQELSEACIACINGHQSADSHSAVGTSPAFRNDNLNSGEMRDLLLVNEVFTNFNTDRLQKLHANLEVLKMNLGDETS